jgi:hypothetical protein
MATRGNAEMKLAPKLLMAGAMVVWVTICSGQSGSFSSQPIADAFVTPGATGSLSSSNFGAAGSLAIAASGLPQGQFQTVIKYDLSGELAALNTQFGVGQWEVQSVTLTLTASPHGNPIFNSVAAGSFAVSLMQNNSWTEGTGTGGIPTSDGISFNSLENVYINPADPALGTFSFAGNTSGQNTYSLGPSSSLVADIMGGDELSLRLFAADNNISYLFSSRNTGAPISTEPTLTVNVVTVPEPSSVLLCAASLLILWLVQAFRRRKRRSG